MKTIQLSAAITEASVIELIRSTIPVATRNKNGLMSKDGLLINGDLGQNNLENIGMASGYTYATGDGSELSGPFISIKGGESIFQIKASYMANVLKFRVYNQVDKLWSRWKTISFT